MVDSVVSTCSVERDKKRRVEALVSNVHEIKVPKFVARLRPNDTHLRPAFTLGKYALI